MFLSNIWGFCLLCLVVGPTVTFAADALHDKNVSQIINLSGIDCRKSKTGILHGHSNLWLSCRAKSCKTTCGTKKGPRMKCGKNGKWESPAPPPGCHGLRRWKDIPDVIQDCRKASNGMPVTGKHLDFKYSDCKMDCAVECKASNETLAKGPHHLGECKGKKWTKYNITHCLTIEEALRKSKDPTREEIWLGVDCNKNHIFSNDSRDQELLQIFSYTNKKGWVICKHSQRENRRAKAPTVAGTIIDVIERHSHDKKGKKTHFHLPSAVNLGKCKNGKWTKAKTGPQVCEYPRHDIEDHSFPWVLLSLSLFLLLGVAVMNFIRVTHIPIPYTVLLLFLGIIFGAIFYAVFRTQTLKLSHAGVIDFDDAWTKTISRWKDFTWSLADAVSPFDILQTFLPILIFESAFGMPTDMFIRSVWSILLVAMPGIIIATLLTALCVTYIPYFDMKFNVALALGATVSATDPVAVVSILAESGAPKYLSVLIEGESLLNDGAAIFLFEMFAEYKGQKEVPVGSGVYKYDALEVTLFMLQVAVLAVFWGLLVGWLLDVIVSRIIDPLAEVTLVLSFAYVGYFMAEAWFGCSGVLTVVVMGLYMGHAKTAISLETEHFLHEFMCLCAWVANTLLFIASGVIIFNTMISVTEAHSSSKYPWWMDLVNILILYGIITVVRSIVLLLFWVLLMHFPGYGFTYKTFIIVVHGALRGAVGLALGLVMARGMTPNPDVNAKGQSIMILLSGIVIITLMFNAVTVTPILKCLGFMRITPMKRRMIDKVVDDIHESMAATTKKLKRDTTYGNVDWNLLEETIAFTNPYDSAAAKEKRKEEREKKKEKKKEEKLKKKKSKMNEKSKHAINVEEEEDEEEDEDLDVIRAVVADAGAAKYYVDRNTNANRRRETLRLAPQMGATRAAGRVDDHWRDPWRTTWYPVPLCVILAPGPEPRSVLVMEGSLVGQLRHQHLIHKSRALARQRLLAREEAAAASAAAAAEPVVAAAAADDADWWNWNESNRKTNKRKKGALPPGIMNVKGGNVSKAPTWAPSAPATRPVDAETEMENWNVNVERVGGSNQTASDKEMAVPLSVEEIEKDEMEDTIRTRILKAQKISFRNQYEHGLISPKAATFLTDTIDYVEYKKRYLEVKDVEKHWEISKSTVRMIRCTECLLKCTGSSQKIPPPKGSCPFKTYKVASRLEFDVTFMIMIVVSCVPMIVQLINPPGFDEEKDRNVLLFYYIVNFVFLFIFFLEFVLRMVAFRQWYFLTIWGVIDCLNLWLMLDDAAIMTFKVAGGFEFGNKTVRSIFVAFRFVRLLRIIRIFRPLLMYSRNRLVNRVNSNLLMGYDIGKAYLNAIDSFYKNIAFMASQSPELTSNLEERFDNERIEVTRALGKLQQSHPGIGVSIKTKHACMILVHRAEEQIDDLKHRGLIDGNEESSLKANTAQIRKKIGKIPPRLPLVEPQQIVKQIKWLRGDEEAQDFFVARMEIKKYERDQQILAPNQKYDGLYLVCSGTVKFVTVAGGMQSSKKKAKGANVNRPTGDEDDDNETDNADDNAADDDADEESFDNFTKHMMRMKRLKYDPLFGDQFHRTQKMKNFSRHAADDDDFDAHLGREDFRAAGFVLNFNCFLEKMERTTTRAICDTDVTVAFFSDEVMKEALEVFSSRFINLEYRMWTHYGRRVTENILNSNYDYQSEELKLKLERGFIVTVLPGKTDKFIIDHEALHVILIQGKATMEANVKGRTEPFLAPSEIPRYILRLKFDNQPARLFIVPKPGGRTVADLGPEHFGVTVEEEEPEMNWNADASGAANADENANFRGGLGGGIFGGGLFGGGGFGRMEEDEEGGGGGGGGGGGLWGRVSTSVKLKKFIRRRINAKRETRENREDEDAVQEDNNDNTNKDNNNDDDDENQDDDDDVDYNDNNHEDDDDDDDENNNNRRPMETLDYSRHATEKAKKEKCKSTMPASAIRSSELVVRKQSRMSFADLGNRCKKHRLAMEELDLTPELAVRIAKETPSVNRLLNLKKGNKMMERMEAAGKVEPEKTLFEAAVCALAYQYLMVKYPDKTLNDAFLTKLLADLRAAPGTKGLHKTHLARSLISMSMTATRSRTSRLNTVEETRRRR